MKRRKSYYTLNFTLLRIAHMKKHFYAYEVGIDEKVDKLKKYLPKNVNNIAGTHRTFPVPRNVPPNVPLFLGSSLLCYSMGEQGR